MITKRTKALELIKGNEMLFKCPVCSENIFINNESFICKKNHSFDIAKKGYMNLLTSNYNSFYSKELFEARHKICESGFYKPLINKISELVSNVINTNKEDISILDAGCGEGSHLYMLSQSLESKGEITFLGTDISKESIGIAARNNSSIIWFVGDLTKLPLKDHSVDIVLNILSPANYQEFHRILEKDGIIIKVVPGNNYLKEIREKIFTGEEGLDYSNEKVVKHLEDNLELIAYENLNYSFPIDNNLLPELLKMTPLTWGKGIDNSEIIEGEAFDSITIDLVILIGKKKVSL